MTSNNNNKENNNNFDLNNSIDSRVGSPIQIHRLSKSDDNLSQNKILTYIEIARFGHTLTIINNTDVILFGGATSINELYNDTLLYNIHEKKWKKINANGNIPCPRAAHASVCIKKNNIVMFGGAKKNGGFASNDLYLLDIRNENYVKWSILTTCLNTSNLNKNDINNNIILENNIKPPERYGHSLIYFKPYLILFGGVLKDKNTLSNDIWLTKLEYQNLFSNPIIKWEHIKPISSEIPEPRIYHTLSIIHSGKAKGMIILFGGRTKEKKALNDCWGLRKHRNNTWEWIRAPNISNYIPIRRFQHTCVSYKNYIVIIGGRNELPEESINGFSLDVYNCEKKVWKNIFNFDKFRHASFIISNFVFMHGGCDMNIFFEHPSSEMVMFDVERICEMVDNDSNNNCIINSNMIFNEVNNNNNNNKNDKNNNNKSDNKESRNKIYMKIEKYKKIDNNNKNNIEKKENKNYKNKPIIINKAELSFLTVSNDESLDNSKDATPNLSIDDINNDSTKKYDNSTNIHLINKLNNLSLIENKKNSSTVILKNEFKIISLDESTKFQELKPNTKEYFELYENFIDILLRPIEWKKSHSQNLIKQAQSQNNLFPQKFKFRREHIIALTKACQEVISSQPIVLNLSTPIKIFGDIHGQFDDLMKFFELWGEPSEDPLHGDINSIDYLFLGDYVDRGDYSLETICLLMALKIKYPEKIFLLRGNHEDHLINCSFGFYDECQERLSNDRLSEELNVFKAINDFFEYLPLVAIIENEIVCLHGGIGAHFNDIKDVENFQRPLKVVHEALTDEEKIVMDILWSDPTDNDNEKGIQLNQIRDSKCYGNIVKFGPDIVDNFLEKNDKSLIIRAHECVLDGFERFCGGKLITVFSAMNYCNRHNNAGGMLLITNNFQIIPHLIYPTNSLAIKRKEKEEYFKKRPPTPLRKRKSNK